MSRGTVTASTRTRRSLTFLWMALFIASILLQYATFSAPAAALAADTPFKAPGATAAPNEWDNPSNALANDGVNANADADDEDQGFVSFGFSLPVGTIVDGITVQAEAVTSDPGCQLQARLSWNNGTSFTGYQTVDLTSSLAVYNLGGATNTWGRTWDPTEVVNGAFKVEIRANDPGAACAIAADGVQVDYVAARVSYRTINDGTANAALSGAVCDAADFNFAIDMSGSIGAQGDIPSNLADLKAGITEFVAAFQNAGGDGRYSGTRFNGRGASTLTSGYQSAATFTTAVNGLASPTGLTPTQAGINTARGNNANDRAGVPNILFVVTDGSPNVPNTHGDDLTVSETWLQGANGAIGAADAARAGGGANQYVVKAVYLSTAGDPGDTNLPFSPAGDSQWAQAVMTEIGGGSFLPADFESF